MREVAGVQPVLRTVRGVHLRKETYLAWELQIEDLKDQVRRAKELLDEVEDIPRIRGRMVGRVCAKTFMVQGRTMTTEPLEIDEALGLATLRGILAVGEVIKRRILPSDRDRV